jgi:hypothetical protein
MHELVASEEAIALLESHYIASRLLCPQYISLDVAKKRVEAS